MFDFLSLITATTDKVAEIVSDKAPEILLGTGVASGGIAIALAARAGSETQIIAEASSTITEQLDNLEATGHFEEKEICAARKEIKVATIKKLSKVWGPVLVSGAVSVISHYGCYKVLSIRNEELKEENLRLTAWGNSLAYTLGAYRSRITDKYGKEADDYAMYGILPEEHKNKSKKSEEKDEAPFVEETAAPGMSLYAQWFDERSRYFEPFVDGDYNIRTVSNISSVLNFDLTRKKFIFLNEVYDALDLPMTENGSIVGWMYDPSKRDQIQILIKKVRVKSEDGKVITKLILDFNPDGPIYDKVFSRRSKFEKQRLYNVSSH